MLLWIVGIIGLCVFLCMVAILAACLVLEAYRARLEFQRDLVSQLTERKWTLDWSPACKEWFVYRNGVRRDGLLAQHPRWEIAVQDALAAVQQPETVER